MADTFNLKGGYMVIWYALLALVSVGFLIAACFVEAEHGFYKAIPLGLIGFAGIIHAFYLYSMYLLSVYMAIN
ncbi:MAG: hypothetical protein NT098_02900 [Candidatus Parcubacteria bacterium]|nr:hypothetical protein [Candidatus Parcubacteria bacterium]